MYSCGIHPELARARCQELRTITAPPPVQRPSRVWWKRRSRVATSRLGGRQDAVAAPHHPVKPGTQRISSERNGAVASNWDRMAIAPSHTRWMSR